MPGNKVKYRLYQYEIRDSKVRTAATLRNRRKVSPDEYSASEAISSDLNPLTTSYSLLQRSFSALLPEPLNSAIHNLHGPRAGDTVISFVQQQMFLLKTSVGRGSEKSASRSLRGSKTTSLTAMKSVTFALFLGDVLTYSRLTRLPKRKPLPPFLARPDTYFFTRGLSCPAYIKRTRRKKWVCARDEAKGGWAEEKCI